MKTIKYKFAVGDKVRIVGSENSTSGCKKHKGEVVTIKSLCNALRAYELEELDNYWTESCFEKV